jgi:hypothetical protein
MREVRRISVLAATLAVSVFALSVNVSAFDLTGAWATSADRCNKVFGRKGRAKRVTFTSFSGIHGGGFIAEPSRLRTKFKNCSIKSRKDDGQNINIVVNCASGIMLSNVQFFLKIDDDDSITRLFPGTEETEINYHRCKM